MRIIIKRNPDWEIQKPGSSSITSKEEILGLRYWEMQAHTLCANGFIKRAPMYPGIPGNRSLETATVAQHLKPDSYVKSQL